MHKKDEDRPPGECCLNKAISNRHGNNHNKQNTIHKHTRALKHSLRGRHEPNHDESR